MSLPPLRLLVVSILSSCLFGCGAEQYDARRLNNTKPFFSDRAELDRHLDPIWSDDGISLRLPAGFEEQNIPDEGPVPIPLPNGRPVKLPGVMGVFTRELSAATADGETKDLPGLIAVLSSRQLQESQEDDDKQDPGQRIELDEFNDAVAARLATNTTVQTIKEKAKQVGGHNFQPTLQYRLSRYEIAGEGGVPYDISLYQYDEQNDKTQVAIIVMAPQELTPGGSFGRHIMDLSLRTLWIRDPASGGTGPVGGSGPVGPNF